MPLPGYSEIIPKLFFLLSLDLQMDFEVWKGEVFKLPELNFLYGKNVLLLCSRDYLNNLLIILICLYLDLRLAVLFVANTYDPF